MLNVKNLIGQEELRRLLTSTLESGKITHAILLRGPAGSEKRSWGRQLAKTLLCQERTTTEPCLKCQSCLSFDRDNNPGFTNLKPDGKTLKTEQVKAIKESFYLTGSIKICLIEEADKMTAEASSSLLKILEDPPAGLTFILLVEQPGQLPDTIVSRCQSYYLRPMPTEELARFLEQEKGMATEKAALVARISSGLLGYALELAADQSLDERIAEARTLAYNLAVGKNPVHHLMGWAEQLALKEDLLPVLELLAMIYRDGLMQNLCRSGDQLQSREQSLIWLEKLMPGDLEEAILLLNQAVYELVATNVNRRLLLEKTLILLQRRLT
ncbi:MAG: hypothetical protein FJ152_09025 [Firmicutes bacterium]|nr:hypothetical protein [Bacillota bacterium]